MYFRQIIALSVVMSGCVSGSYHTATPIPSGAIELGAAVGVVSQKRQEQEYEDLISTSDGTFLMYDVFLRYGVNDWSDLGLQFNIFGVLAGSLRADYNVNLINTDSFALSMAPALQLLGSTDGGAERISGDLGLFVDVLKSESTIFSLNIKPGFEYLSESPTLGSGVLLHHRIAQSWFLLPFVDLYWRPGRVNYAFEVYGGIGVAYRIR